jgi:PAS domain S-box-containing protein
LDLATLLKVSQTVSSEIVLQKLIDTLMRTAIEHAGAERGLLIMPRDNGFWTQAEATTSGSTLTIGLRDAPISSVELPETVVQCAARTQESVIIDDASAPGSYSNDEYIRRSRPRSILCLPLVKQGWLIALLYLENKLAAGALTHARIAVLNVVASAAAISLENASLYSDLQRSEAFLAQGQALSHTGSFGWSVLSGEIYWSEETYKIFEHDRGTKPTLEWAMQRIHPDDRDRVQHTLDRASEEGADFDLENRLLMADGSVKYVHVLGRALKTSAENLEFVGAVTDVTAAKQAEEELRYREAELLEAQRLSCTGSWKHDIASGRVTVSPEVYRIFGVRPDEVQSNTEFWLNRNHPEDAKRIQELFEKSEIQKTDYEANYRIVLPDGAVKHLHAIGHPIINEKGDLVEFVGTVMDVTAAKQAEAKIRQDADELRRITDSISQAIVVYDPEGRPIHVNRAGLEYTGLSWEEVRAKNFRERFVHPEDIEKFTEVRQNGFLKGVPFENELRGLGKDGKYRWFLTRYSPFRDEQGRLVRWYATSIDIEDRKVAEQRLQNENIALREDVDRASMFEEIVGESPALLAVLAQVAKVGPTDSTVLITGETGTGKELLARAIHKRSRRSGRTFVSVNCAALAPSLISSELFGHEKGAFTGATQRRLGRFELADGGTIFLDEVGELPPDTQVALLRVLQEREFERVGGTQPVHVDVRVIRGAYVQVHLKLPTTIRSMTIPANTLLFRREGLRVGVVREGLQIEMQTQLRRIGGLQLHLGSSGLGSLFHTPTQAQVDLHSSLYRNSSQ